MTASPTSMISMSLLRLRIWGAGVQISSWRATSVQNWERQTRHSSRLQQRRAYAQYAFRAHDANLQGWLCDGLEPQCWRPRKAPQFEGPQAASDSAAALLRHQQALLGGRPLPAKIRQRSIQLMRLLYQFQQAPGLSGALSQSGKGGSDVSVRGSAAADAIFRKPSANSLLAPRASSAREHGRGRPRPRRDPTSSSTAISKSRS